MPRTCRFAARAAALAIAFTALSGASSPAVPGRAGPDAVADVPGLRDTAAPVAAGSGQPQVSVAPDGSFLLSWLEPAGEGTTRLRASRFDGTTWTVPVTIAEGHDFFVNWADVPSVIQLRGGRLAAHWLQKSGPGTYAYDVKLKVSDDGGRTWSRTVTPHRDGTQAEHGFVSLVDMGNGRVGLVWLDGREMAGGEHGGHGSGGGAMTLRAATLGPDLAIGDEALLDDRVCECCPTAAVHTPDGLAVAYRNRGPNEVRDVFVARLSDGRWLPGRAVHDDKWRIAACPVNGPSLAADGPQVAIAWFTAEGDTPRVMAAFSTDAGKTFGPPTRVDDAATLGRVAAEMLGDGSLLVGWVEFLQGGSEFRVRRIAPDGTRGPSMRVGTMRSSRASGYPRLARSGSTLLFAWTDTREGSRVAVATAPVAPDQP